MVQEDLYSKFANAARDGRISVLREMLDKNEVGIDDANEAGMTGLMVACCCYRADVIRFLIENGANDELKNVHGMTAMDIITQSNHPELGLEKVFDDAKRNRLAAAAEAGDLRAVERIIKLGDDVNGEDIVKECPLKYASNGGHVDVMKYLVEHGADVDKANEYGMTPLMSAVCRFDAKSVRCLIELGADEKLLNNKGRSAETMARDEIIVVLENAVKRRESQKVMPLKRDKGIDR